MTSPGDNGSALDEDDELSAGSRLVAVPAVQVMPCAAGGASTATSLIMPRSTRSSTPAADLTAGVRYGQYDAWFASDQRPIDQPGPAVPPAVPPAVTLLDGRDRAAKGSRTPGSAGREESRRHNPPGKRRAEADLSPTAAPAEGNPPGSPVKRLAASPVAASSGPGTSDGGGGGGGGSGGQVVHPETQVLQLEQVRSASRSQRRRPHGERLEPQATTSLHLCSPGSLCLRRATKTAGNSCRPKQLQVLTRHLSPRGGSGGG